MKEVGELEATYLESDDPVAQSGFSGGRERWIAERSPLVEAFDHDGTFLDVGCANGLLAADVVRWAARRGMRITPFGIDLGPTLVHLAKNRFSSCPDNFYVADAWTWQPVRQWTYVYSLLDLAPRNLRCTWIDRLLRWVEPGGRLILGSYGSRSLGVPPEDLLDLIEACGKEATGSAAGGDPVTARFAWVAA